MYEPKLGIKYKEEIIPILKQKLSTDESVMLNTMRVPRLQKICLNQGVGAAVSDKNLIDNALDEMTKIAGQKAVATRSKKDISNFKLRKHVEIGVRVTLRRHTMYEFLERLICVALPRIRDFKGLSLKGFDGRGNWTFGIREQLIFPEINIDQTSKVSGMDVTFVTTAETDQEAFELLKAFGLPFQQEQKEAKKILAYG